MQGHGARAMLVCAAALCLAGCGAGEQPAPAGVDSTAAAGAREGPRSVLAYDCQGQYVVAELSPDHAWVFLPGATVKLPREVSASGERYADQGVVFWTRGDEAMLEQQGARVNCQVDRFNTPFEAAKLDGADFRGIGNEPGWELVMYHDRIRFTWDYGAERIEFPAVAHETSQAELSSRWVTVAQGRQLEVVIQARSCNDTMADYSYESTVTVRLDGREFRGCGKALH